MPPYNRHGQGPKHIVIINQGIIPRSWSSTPENGRKREEEAFRRRKRSFPDRICISSLHLRNFTPILIIADQSPRLHDRHEQTIHTCIPKTTPIIAKGKQNNHQRLFKILEQSDQNSQHQTIPNGTFLNKYCLDCACQILSLPFRGITGRDIQFLDLGQGPASHVIAVASALLHCADIWCRLPYRLIPELPKKLLIPLVACSRSRTHDGRHPHPSKSPSSTLHGFRLNIFVEGTRLSILEHYLIAPGCNCLYLYF